MQTTPLRVWSYRRTSVNTAKEKKGKDEDWMRDGITVLIKMF